jgi:hypothetical protein
VCGPRRRWQEDAHEFLIQLLDAMHTTEVNEAGGVTKLDDVTQVRHAAGCSLPSTVYPIQAYAPVSHLSSPNVHLPVGWLRESTQLPFS